MEIFIDIPINYKFWISYRSLLLNDVGWLGWGWIVVLCGCVFLPPAPFRSTSSESFSLDRQDISLPCIGTGANLVRYWTGLAHETCSKLPASCWIIFLPVQLLELDCCGDLMTPWVNGVWGDVGEGSVWNFPPESLPRSVGLWVLSRNGLPRPVLCVLLLGVCLTLHRDDLSDAECP